MYDDALIQRVVNTYNGTLQAEELELARRIATKVYNMYGNDIIELKQIQQHGIWNDHPAVQSALVAIRLCKGLV